MTERIQEEREVLTLSNQVIKVDLNKIEQMKKYYAPFLLPKTPQGAVFLAKTEGCTITAYRSGKVLFQGPNSSEEANRWEIPISNTANKSKQGKNSSPFAPPELIGTMSIIGSDEVGTGDYFGPITVTAVYVEKTKIQTLQSLGVKDSKHLNDTQIISIAKKILKEVPYSLLVLHNEKNNDLQKNGMTQGKMKAILHNQAITHVLNKVKPTEPEGILIDQFAEPSVYFRHNANKTIPLKEKTYFSTKAEGVHIAVAAASILSRYAFLHEMDKLSERAGFQLPKGAGAKVDELAAMLITKKGVESLKYFTKMHFANTEKAMKRVK